MDTPDPIWAALAAPLPAASIQWRQDGKPTQRGQRWLARFVAYVDAGTVRERLDAVVPGKWALIVEALPELDLADEDARCSFKAKIIVREVIRECVGSGKDYKTAATDAFKRCAVRFGIGHELYDLEPLWVEVDGDGKYAKPLEDQATVYARQVGGAKPTAQPPWGPELAPGATARDLLAAMLGDPDMTPEQRTYVQSKLEDGDLTDEQLDQLAAKVQLKLSGVKALRVATATAAATTKRPPAATGHSNDGASNPGCPDCGGRMWDNRVGKKNPKAPDFKCKDRQCDGVIWPPKDGEKARPRATAPADEDYSPSFGGVLDEEDDLPF